MLEATPARVYRALTDGRQFSEMTEGAPAEIEATIGGAFSCFGGMIFGRNVECVPDERLVHARRVKTWQPGVYSIARFELRPEGGTTRVVLDHAGFPHDQREHLEQGWHANYWDPLRRFFARRPA